MTHIVVDSREQKPFWTGSQCMKTALLVGDYSTIKLLNKFAIERKSLQDLYGSIVQGHVRFRNELIRAQVNGIQLVVVVEGTKKNFIKKKFPGGERRNMESATLEKIVNTIEQRYKVEVIWCTSRSAAKKTIYNRLLKEEKKLKQ